MTKYAISNETASIYKLGDNDTIWYLPINRDGTYDYETEDDWNLVEEDLVSEEPINSGRTLGDVYTDVRKLLA